MEFWLQLHVCNSIVELRAKYNYIWWLSWVRSLCAESVITDQSATGWFTPNDDEGENGIQRNIYVSLQLRVQNAVSAQPCVGKLGISLVLLNFLGCNFRLWFETP